MYDRFSQRFDEFFLFVFCIAVVRERSNIEEGERCGGGSVSRDVETSFFT